MQTSLRRVFPQQSSPHPPACCWRSPARRPTARPRAWSAMPTTTTRSTSPTRDRHPCAPRSGRAQPGLSSEVEVELRSDTRTASIRVRDLGGRLGLSAASAAAAADDEARCGIRFAGAPLPVGRGDTATAARASTRPLFRDRQCGRADPRLRLYRETPAGGYYGHRRRDPGQARGGDGPTTPRLRLRRRLLLLSPPASPPDWAFRAVSPARAPGESLRWRARRRPVADRPQAVPRRVREVVRALNGLLERQRNASARQREFLQDAAHQLRTRSPACRCSSGCSSRASSTRPRGTALRVSVARVIRLANQLLALAARRSRRPPGRGCVGSGADRADRPPGRGLDRACRRPRDRSRRRARGGAYGRRPHLLQELIVNPDGQRPRVLGDEGGKISLLRARRGPGVHRVDDDGPASREVRANRSSSASTATPAPAPAAAAWSVDRARDRAWPRRQHRDRRRPGRARHYVR